MKTITLVELNEFAGEWTLTVWSEMTMLCESLFRSRDSAIAYYRRHYIDGFDTCWCGCGSLQHHQTETVDE